MPTTFFNQNGDYYETITEISTPEGHTVAPKMPNAFDVWDDQAGAWVAGPVPAPTVDDVNAEKDRRKASFEFNGVTYQSDTVSLVNIGAAGSIAGFAMAQGAAAGDYLWHGGAEPFGWIAANNSVVQMDAGEMFAFAQAAAAHVSQITFAAKNLKALDPIPEDFAADHYWGAA